MKQIINLSQTPLPEQEGPSTGTSNTLEMMSTKELAYHMTCYDWELFSCIHEVQTFPESNIK